jgi:hypothetical protein
MAQAVSNFQYVGYLSDVLQTYNDIDVLTAQFNCAKTNYDNAQAALDEYKNTFCLKNCVLAWCMMMGVLLLLTCPFLFLPRTSIIAWLVFCALIASVIIVVSKLIYQKKVFPAHKSFLEDERNRAEVIYKKSYESLVARRANLQDLREGIEEQCTYPLSVYMMREAAKEGECSNIPQGIRYFKNRYKTLETATEESSISLKARIDNEQDKYKARQDFLVNLDEKAQTLFQ